MAHTPLSWLEEWLNSEKNQRQAMRVFCEYLSLEGSEASSARQQVVNENDDGEHQQNVDQASTNVQGEA
jgi:hypothetical protein